MSELDNFREVNEIEKKIILNSLFKISSKTVKSLENKNYFLFISFNNLTRNGFPLIYLTPSAITKLLSIRNVKNNTISAGIFFGFIRKGEFMLSLECIEFLLKQNWISENQKLYLTIEGEKSVLYGNQIKKNMIERISTSLKKNSYIVIFNIKKEFIAIGKSNIHYEDFERSKSDDIIVINLVDKGYYLRKKQ